MRLITGNNGFIGQNLTKRFPTCWVADKDECFKTLDNPSSFWKDVRQIWHMGAISDTTCNEIDTLYEYNVLFTLALFEKAIKYQIPIKYASSASVYGNAGNEMVNPLNQYAMSKATIDLWVRDNIHRFEKIHGYRFFNVYGDHEDHKGAQASPVHTFTKQAKETGVIKVFEGSTLYKRDFVWVEDAIDCMMFDKPSGIYDVGTSKPVSFLSVAEAIAEKYNAKIETIPFPKHLQGKYQFKTRSRQDFNLKFTTVKEYLRKHV